MEVEEPPGDWLSQWAWMIFSWIKSFWQSFCVLITKPTKIMNVVTRVPTPRTEDEIPHYWGLEDAFWEEEKPKDWVLQE